MARLEPLAREELEEFEPFFQALEQGMGFVPNSVRTMAHRPELLRAFGAFAGGVLGEGAIDPELKQLVAFVASRAAGCRYCQAHTAHSAHRVGASTERIDAAFDFEASPLFSEAERAALRLARDAALAPSAADESHFAALSEHFSAAEIVEIMGVIAFFGFLNRWNDAMATTLEEEPLAFAREQLASRGWSAGAHAGKE